MFPSSDARLSEFDREIAQYFVRHVPLSEVMEMTEGFSPSRLLGEGGFAFVYLGVSKDKKCAVKRAKETSKISALDDFKNEVCDPFKCGMNNWLCRHDNHILLYSGPCHLPHVPCQHCETSGVL